MSLRIFSSALAFALAACGAETPPAPPPPGDTVDCAIGAAVELSPVCTLEQVAGTQEFVIHHPDGGFRRLLRDPATGALAPLDGAEPMASAQADGGALQVAVGQDRYRIPAELLTPAAQ